MSASLRRWATGPEGKALGYALISEVIAITLDALIAVIQNLHQNSDRVPFDGAVAANVLSFQWDLIFIGLGTLIGSFLSVPRTRRRPEPLIGPFYAVMFSLVIIAFLYAIWPWIGPVWIRVFVTDMIGVGIIIYCVRMASRVRQR